MIQWMHSFRAPAIASESECKSRLHGPDILDLHVAGVPGSGQRINGMGYYDAEWICIKLHKVNWWLRYTGTRGDSRVAAVKPGVVLPGRDRKTKRERELVERRRGYTWRHRIVVLFCRGIARTVDVGERERARKRERGREEERKGWTARSVCGVRVSLCFVSPPCFINQRNKQKRRARARVAGKAVLLRRDASRREQNSILMVNV